MAYAESDRAFVVKLIDAGVKIDTVYDIGASNGGWSRVIAQAIPSAKFELFEPLAYEGSPYWPVLSDNLKQHRNFSLRPVALGESDSTAPMYVYHDMVGSSMIGSMHSGVKERKAVPVRALDSYRREQALPSADLIKIDVQGSELSILKGAEESCRSAGALMIETWLYRGYGAETPLLSDIIALLEKWEFGVVTFGDRYVGPDLFIHAIDAFFLRKDVAAGLAQRNVHIQ